MKPQDFLQYLEQPRLLYQLPLTSLQALALEYPYSPNLRLLLLLKTHLDGHPQEGEYLNRCASAAFDRVFIYDLLRDPALKQSATEDELDTLELMALDDIALEEAAILEGPPEEEENSTTSYTDLFPPLDLEQEEVEIELPELDDVISQTIPTAPEKEDQWVENAAAYVSSLPNWSRSVAHATVSSPEPVSRFAPNYNPNLASSLQERLRSIRQVQASKLADAQEEVRKIARRSLVAQEAVASETLAQLLVRQGQYKNALKMYQRLSLLYPEKKTIFAGLIKDLKEKL